MKSKRWICNLIISGIIFTTGCSLRFAPSSSSNPIGVDCHSQIVERIYLGLNSPNGPVDDRAWNDFLDKEITPRFPEGLTIFSAQGQWQGKSAQIEHENSKIVEIVHDDSGESSKAISEISKAYKDRFQQEAVLVLREFVYGCMQ